MFADDASKAGRRARQAGLWRTGAVLGFAGATGMTVFMVLPVASATPSEKVTICHRTAAETNPYVVITIDSSSIDEPGNQYLNGHGDHTGPVFEAGMTSDWGDIIPPFTDSLSGVSFPGYNWGGAGEAIWSAGCAIPEPTPTPTPTTPTPTPTTVTPTPTTLTPTPTTPTPTTSTPEPTTTTPSPVTTTPEPTTSTPEPTTTTPSPVTTTPAPVTTTPQPTSGSPTPVTSTPAPVTTSPSTSVITSPSIDGGMTQTGAPSAVGTKSRPNSGRVPTAVSAGGGLPESPGKPPWLWSIAVACVGLLIGSLRRLYVLASEAQR